MKKDLTIGGIGARSTSVRRRIMKRVCKENVNGVKTNLVMSDIADVILFYPIPTDPSFFIKLGFLKTTSTIIREDQTLSLSDYSILIVNNGQSLTNNGSITINNYSQIAITNVTYSPPSPPVEGTTAGGILINNGNLLISSFSSIYITGKLTNNGSLKNTNRIYVYNGGTMINTGTITNTDTINIANGSGGCGSGNFTAGSYIGTTGTDCP
jgi:hypothetical protein